jgi:ABC-type Co2+ transport system permease subunit
VALTVAASGLFMGILAASAASQVVRVRRRRALVFFCVGLAGAVTAYVMWSLLGYDAVARHALPPPHRDATMSAAVERSAASSSADVRSPVVAILIVRQPA